MSTILVDDKEDEDYTESESGSASRLVGRNPFGLSDKAGDGRGGGGRTRLSSANESGSECGKARLVAALDWPSVVLRSIDSLFISSMNSAVQ